MSATSLEHIEKLCTERGVRLTEQRRRVLGILLESERPMGAYDIMQAMDAQAADSGHRTAPPTVYRALDFLQNQGFIHRIAAIQAYVTCSSPDHRHAGQFLVCTDCGRVDELDDQGLDRTVEAAASARGFSAESHVEVSARCDACDDTSSDKK